MKTMLNEMKNKKNNIPESCLPLFEDIMLISDRNERNTKFINAMEKYLTKEQCFTIWAKNGACRGMKFDKDRKSFATEYGNKPLSERFDIFVNTIGSGYKSKPNDILLDEKTKTITISFACKHGSMHLEKGISTSLEAYFGQCAGGRLYELQLALGINLKIKDIDVTGVKNSIKDPCVFTFEIIA
ncbi:hypothetical protein ACQPUZ_08040 [Clostridium tertium]